MLVLLFIRKILLIAISISITLIMTVHEGRSTTPSKDSLVSAEDSLPGEWPNNEWKNILVNFDENNEKDSIVTGATFFFVHKPTIVVNKNISKFWLMVSKLGDERSTSMRIEAQCNNFEYRNGELMMYDGAFGRGNVVSSRMFSSAQWQAVPPDSAIQSAVNYACEQRYFWQKLLNWLAN